MKILNRVEIRKSIKDVIDSGLIETYIIIRDNKFEIVAPYIGKITRREYDKIYDITNLIIGDYDMKYIIDIIQNRMMDMI